MEIFVGILVCVAATIFVILGWEMIRYCIADWYLTQQTIEDVKVNITSKVKNKTVILFIYVLPLSISYRAYTQFLHVLQLLLAVP